LAFYILEIKEGLKGEEVVVSRTNKGLLEGLFKREVPEVAQGTVEIKAIERDPGNRSKVAVFSNQPGIDPVGSCVGQKGVRVQAIISELSGIEKIDIIQWQENPKNYIIQALSPAKQLKVDLDEKEKLAKVRVAPEELSLAIGKDGQNVRLASRLTGFRIEIEGDEKLSTTPKEEADESTKEIKLAKEVKELVEEEEKTEEKPKIDEQEHTLSQTLETAVKKQDVLDTNDPVETSNKSIHTLQNSEKKEENQTKG
jgi:N utilization substance protein A